MTVTSMSEAEFKAHYAWLNPIAAAISHSQRKSGTWSERHNRQQIAFKKAESQGYYSAWREQIAIENNPVNIARWKKEAQEIIDIENKRLLDIQKEEKRIKDQIIQKEREDAIFKAGMEESARLQKIEDQMITFNEQQNSGDFNDTPITEINPMDSCLGCGFDVHNLPYDDWVVPDDFYDIPNKDKENYLKIGGIAAVGVVAYLVFKK